MKAQKSGPPNKVKTSHCNTIYENFINYYYSLRKKIKKVILKSITGGTYSFIDDDESVSSPILLLSRHQSCFVIGFSRSNFWQLPISTCSVGWY